MLKALKRIATMAAVVFGGVWLLVQWKGANPPDGLGIKEGQLGDCPDTPNCVCSQSEGSHKMEPLHFQGEAAAAKTALKNVLAKKHIRIAEEQDNYIHAVATTPIMRYQDDLEFLLDPAAKTIHFRSASRLGKSDLGKNRARLTEIFADLRKDPNFQSR